MFNYAKDSDNAPTYRPDLLPVITRWLALVPAGAWQYFVGFRVGLQGEFIAKFMVPTDQDGTLRAVRITVDHHECVMSTDTHLWIEPRPVQLTVADLHNAANTF